MIVLFELYLVYLSILDNMAFEGKFKSILQMVSLSTFFLC